MKILTFFLIICLPSFSSAKFVVKDSLGIEISNNIVYILHKVEPGQTLYSLVSKYNCSVTEVSSINPSLNSGVSIKSGEVLKFPMIKNGKHVSAWAYNNNLKSSKAVKESEVSQKTKDNIEESNKSPKLHLIKAGETIFSISKLYDLDISYLVEANKINNNKIKIGEKLIVDKVEIEKIVSDFEKKESPALELLPIGIRMQETGVAEVINTSNRTNKYLALHRTAKVGSIIKVTNEATGLSITAKVVGNLNEKGPDENIMLKLSPFAFYKLRPRDSKLRATVEYYVPVTRKTMSLK